MVATQENFPLLAELLAEQQRLDTPVARFSAGHDDGRFAAGASHHAALIPLSAPGPGEHYAFEVDLDACTGCKSCVAACHALNGLDDSETWRDVGLIVSPSRARPFTQTITSACHHCADPACLNGCPVLAYEKDPRTGIVRHLDDQCIGCSYCILKCPYDAPKFSARLGIVRKCDMCHGRLAAGEAPACAQACPTHAIRIVTVRNEPSQPETGYGIEAPPCGAGSARGAPGSRAPDAGFLPGAPDPGYTQPTTRYVTRRTLPNEVVAADAGILQPQPAHWPLVVMLTLVPAAVGAALAAWLLAAAFPGPPIPGGAPNAFVTYYVTNFLSLRGESVALVTYYVTIGSWVLGVAGLAASGLHLGRPLRAWRVFLGWRRSWLSREAILLGAWFAVASGALIWPVLRAASAALGLLALGCSAMIYVDTRRQFWRAAQTFPRFFGVAALVALALVAPLGAALVLGLKVGIESRSRFDGSISARLQRGPLARAVGLRDALAVLAMVLLVAAPGALALAVLIAGELAERHLYFRAVDAPKMPGMPA